MKKRSKPNSMKALIISILVLFTFISCKDSSPQKEVEKSEKLGSIDFQFSGNPNAQPLFRKGLLLMHNFEYDDARDAFLEAQQADSSMLMAYWGEAMTHNHPLWREQEFDDGKAALEKIGSTPAERMSKAGSAIEKDWLSAIEILYGEGKKKDRDIAYNEFMKGLYKKHPKDHEVAAFYALSCLGAGNSRSIEAYEKGAKIVQGIIEENPDHPGALHYLIHSYDDPGHAKLALSAANRYSKVAADAAHALHMPSHIYVAVGMWDEVVNCNIASWNASLNRMEDKELDGNARSYHAFHWWMYGLLQKGKFEEATSIMKKMDEYITDESKKSGRSYLISMKGNYLIETGNWKDSISAFEREMEDLNIVSRNVFDYVEGNHAFVNNDKEKLNEVLEAMAKRRSFAETLVSDTGAAMCSSGGANRFKPNQTDINLAHIMEMELRALRSWNTPEAEEWLQKATQLEKETSYAYGPPKVVQPSFELYGKWLLENGKAEAALAQYEIASSRGPNRIAAMKGKLEALKALKRSADAEQVLADLKQVLKDADAAVLNQYVGQKQMSSL